MVGWRAACTTEGFTTNVENRLASWSRRAGLAVVQPVVVCGAVGNAGVNVKSAATDHRIDRRSNRARSTRRSVTIRRRSDRASMGASMEAVAAKGRERGSSTACPLRRGSWNAARRRSGPAAHDEEAVAGQDTRVVLRGKALGAAGGCHDGVDAGASLAPLGCLGYAGAARNGAIVEDLVSRIAHIVESPPGGVRTLASASPGRVFDSRSGRQTSQQLLWAVKANAMATKSGPLVKEGANGWAAGIRTPTT